VEMVYIDTSNMTQPVVDVSTGSRAAGTEAQTPRLVGACERQARVFLGGALRCLAQKKEKKKLEFGYA
jgi:hypothetical protein